MQFWLQILANIISSEFRGWLVRHESEAHPPCADITSALFVRAYEIASISWLVGWLVRHKSMAHPPRADMISWTRHNWLVWQEPGAHLSCADIESSTFRTWFVKTHPVFKILRLNITMISSLEHNMISNFSNFGCFRIYISFWEFRSDQGIPWSERNFQTHIWKRNADSKFKLKI